MQIERVRRLGRADEWPKCDYCDEEFTAGFCFSGEGVGGPRSGVFLCVCDKCLKKTKESKIGFLHDVTPNNPLHSQGDENASDANRDS
jgi:hypothetical protein